MSRVRWLALALWAAGAACGDDAPTSACRRDGDCGAGQACVASACVAQTAPTTAWVLELVPKAGTTAAPTRLPAQQLAPTGNRLALDHKVRVTGTIARPTGNLAEATLEGTRVVVTVDVDGSGARRSFEAEARSDGRGAAVAFALQLPSQSLGRRASVWCRPPDATLAAVPPWGDEVTIGPELRLAPPGPAELATVEGKLVNVFGEAELRYRARALSADRVVSNEATTSSEGSFRVLVPLPGQARTRETLDAGVDAAVPVATSIDASAGPDAGVTDPSSVTVELLPPRDATQRPRLTVGPVALARNLSLGKLELPDERVPETFRLPITGGDERAGIVGATVRLRAVVPGTRKAGLDGITFQAIFSADAQSDAGGVAELKLVPGSTERPKLYDLAVVPPAGSPHHPRCVTGYPIVGAADPASTQGPRTTAPIELGRKPTVRGRVRAYDGRPAAGVTITLTALAPIAGCSTEVLAPPESTVTDAEGRYTLAVTRGRHRLAVTPGEGSSLVPHAQEITVDRDGDLDTTLPESLVVTGVVVGPEGAAADACEVRAIGASGLVAGRAFTGPDGAFRLVLPR